MRSRNQLQANGGQIFYASLVFLSVLAVVGSTGAAFGKTQVSLICHPKDNTARILASRSPNDLHVDWQGQAIVGRAIAFQAKLFYEANGWGTRYFRGDIYSTRGGLLNENVYIISSEWECRKS